MCYIYQIEFRSYKLYLYERTVSVSIWTLDRIIIIWTTILLYIKSFLNNSRSTITNCYLTFLYKNLK